MTVISNQIPPRNARIRCFAREPCSTNLSRRCRSRACDLWSNASGLCCWKSRCSLAFMGSSENEGIHEQYPSMKSPNNFELGGEKRRSPEMRGGPGKEKSSLSGPRLTWGPLHMTPDPNSAAVLFDRIERK